MKANVNVISNNHYSDNHIINQSISNKLYSKRGGDLKGFKRLTPKHYKNVEKNYVK